MTEPLQVGQFAIVDHEPVERGPNAGVFTGRGPAGDRPELYLLAEGTTPAGEAFAGHIISAAGQRWASIDMSVTGALKRVFEDANDSLIDWNRKSIAQHRVRLGLAGFARRGDQYVLAQAGPSAVFHVTADTVEAYFTDEEHATPLGSAPQVSPQFRRLQVAPGDRLLLISTAALGELDDEVLTGILSLPAEQVLPNLFRRVRGLRDVTALLLAYGEQSPASLPALESDAVIGAGEREDTPDGFQPSLFISERGEDEIDNARRQLVAVSERVRMSGSVVPAVAMPVPVPEPLRRVASGEVAPPPLDRTRASLAASAPLPRQLSAPGGAQRGFTPGRDGGSFIRSISSRKAPPPPPPLTSDAPPVSELADDQRARQRPSLAVVESLVADDGPTIESEPLVRVRNAPRTRFRAGSGALGRREIPTWKGHPPTWLIALGGIALLLAVVAFVAGPKLIEGDADGRFVSLVTSAERDLATARALQDPADRRAAYTRAHASLLEARDMAPESTQVSSLLLQVEDGLKQLDAVREPVAVDDLASLEQFGAAPVTADSLVVAGETVYLLDTAGGQVIRVPLDGSLPGAAFAADAAAGRGRPIALAYYAAADLGGPVMLVADADRRLWNVIGGAVEPVRFAVPGDVTDIAVWDNDLYVLDAPGRTVYRLIPAEGGFVNPDPILTGDELANAARLTVVGEEIYTADGNGVIHRFAGSLSLALGAAGIDKPLSSARKPWAGGENGEIAVLDPANNRIVILAQDGAFSHQYRHPDFAASRAFALDGDRGYIFSGGHLRMITFTE